PLYPPVSPLLPARPPSSPLFPYTTLFRSRRARARGARPRAALTARTVLPPRRRARRDRPRRRAHRPAGGGGGDRPGPGRGAGARRLRPDPHALARTGGDPGAELVPGSTAAGRAG